MAGKTRVDILLYGHDGRGLGHVSRSIAIGAALRRLYPSLKVLFITGSSQTQSLIGSLPLDWIKLPSYFSVIEDGIGRNRLGHTNIKNSFIVSSRSQLLREILQVYQPRLVLVDHIAGGKREELLPAMKLMSDTCFVLGLRGLLGNVKALWTPETIAVFEEYFSGVLWYGDRAVLGDETPRTINEKLAQKPFEAGYVSRLREFSHLSRTSRNTDQKGKLAGVMAVTWKSPTALRILQRVSQVLEKLGGELGEWHIYSNFGHELFTSMDHCHTFELHPDYLHSLMRAKAAIVYGGYNSLTDILAARKPGVILQRIHDDEEQRQHASQLHSLYPDHLFTISEEEADRDTLHEKINRLLTIGDLPGKHLQLDGAARAAEELVRMLG